jgi:phenylacetate-CoA ligase
MRPRGPDLLGIARALHRHPRADRAQLQAFQDAKLRHLLVHAYENVPYYRKLFDRHRLHPRHVRGAIDLDLIPVTTEHDLQAAPPADLLARGVDASSLVTVRGTSPDDEPFAIRRTRLEQEFHTMFRQRAYESFGLKLRARVAVVACPRPADQSETKLLGRWLSAMGVHPTLRVDGTLEPRTIVDQLSAFRPDLLTSHPAVLSRIAEYLLTATDRRLHPGIVVVDGDPILPAARRRLTEAFGVAPLQTWATREFQLLAWECRTAGHLHTCDDGAIVEVLRDERPALPGEEGALLATNLHAYAMPFIRYRLSGLATRGAAACACGQPFSVIGALRSAPLND